MQAKHDHFWAKLVGNVRNVNLDTVEPWLLNVSDLSQSGSEQIIQTKTHWLVNRVPQQEDQ